MLPAILRRPFRNPETFLQFCGGLSGTRKPSCNFAATFPEPGNLPAVLRRPFRNQETFLQFCGGLSGIRKLSRSFVFLPIQERAANLFMFLHAIHQDDVQDDDFVQIIRPDVAGKHDDEHDERAAVEGHEVDVAHQMLALAAEIGADLRREVVAITPMQVVEHLLEDGRRLHLDQRVPTIKQVEELRDAVFRLLMLRHDLLQALELGALLFRNEIEMERLVIIGDVGLQEMRHRRKHREGKEPVGTRLVRQAGGEAEINRSEPDIPGKAIQDAAYLRLDARQARQLPVYAIQDIGKDEAKDAIHRIFQLRVVKEETRGRPDEDREDGNHVRRHARVPQKARDLEPDRPIKHAVNEVFRLDGLQRRFIFLVQIAHLYSVIYRNNRHLRRRFPH